MLRLRNNFSTWVYILATMVSHKHTFPLQNFQAQDGRNLYAYLPAAAMCSLVRMGWNPTNGICIDNSNPVMKKTL